MDSKIVCFCLIFMQCSVQIQSLECPQCVDAKSTFFGMQNNTASVMKDALKQMEHILCRTNQAEPTACNVATSGHANKCTNVFATMNMKGHHAGVNMKFEIISRGCTPRPIGEADKCIDFTDSEEYSVAKHLIATLQQQYDIVTFSGQICYQSSYIRGYQQPLQKKSSADWRDSFAYKVHVSNILFVISILFSLKLFV